MLSFNRKYVVFFIIFLFLSEPIKYMRFDYESSSSSSFAFSDYLIGVSDATQLPPLLLFCLFYYFLLRNIFPVPRTTFHMTSRAFRSFFFFFLSSFFFFRFTRTSFHSFFISCSLLVLQFPCRASHNRASLLCMCVCNSKPRWFSQFYENVRIV